MVVELTELTFDDFVEANDFVLIDCWAPWCGPCRRMGPIIEELADELKGKVAVAKLNTDEAPGISARFQIEAIPTLLIFKNRLMLSPLVGLRPKTDILAYLQSQGMLPGAEPAKEEEHFAEVVTDNNFNDFIKSKDYALIDCWAPWCKPCLRMGPVIEKLAEISQNDIAVGKLNVDENPKVTMGFGIESIPTLLIYKGGVQRSVKVGFNPSLTAESLREMILDL